MCKKNYTLIFLIRIDSEEDNNKKGEYRKSERVAVLSE